jgi:hypothetical protein
MLELAAPQQRLLGPFRPSEYSTRDWESYVNTSYNQIFSKYGQPQPF